MDKQKMIPKQRQRNQFELIHPALKYVENDEHDGDDRIYVSGQMEVCPRCEGTGVHDRQDIDTTKLVDDMREDCDYEGLENYFNGSYDVVCTRCKGKNVVFVPIAEEIPKWASDAIESWDREEANSRAEAEAERRMGA